MKNKDQHIAYCGFNCSKCPVYQATINHDEKLKAKLAYKYSTKTSSLSVHDISCLGCKSNRISKKICAECNIRLCAISKKIEDTCALCSSFPCDLINTSIPRGQGTRDYLDQLNKQWKHIKE